MLLDGADHIALINHLAKTTNGAVVLEDAAHQIRGWVAGRVSGADEIMSNWDTHSRASHTGNERREHGLLCRVDDVALRGEVWGRLHVLYSSDSLTDTENQAITQAVASVAITLLSERARRASIALRSTALLNQLALGEIDGAEAVRLAQQLGVQLSTKQVLAVATHVDDTPAIASALTSKNIAHLSGEIASHTQWILAVRRERDEAIVVEILRRLGTRAGLSRVLDISRARHAVRQSKQALDGTSIEGPARVRRFDELGVARLLVTLSPTELASYVEDEIGALLDHDARNKNALLPTLRTFLQVGGARSVAAYQLHVQRRSLYYRLDRIESVLGLSLADPAVRSRLYLAVQGFDLLRASEHMLPI